ncbi:hypothetical protein [Actinomarinicola tropica]|uniref:Transcription factor zinc-finger domain-containing protein n=1 Tax=Actinomarinicola tropica TaxID=2789776 RepID=A0A5Q2RN25_9ACTN|nr:hypothetical protein [Actinomarinicola tropica]QGG95806.1 hypothetical protein GH723_12245 [Actinomarinicola tropica]
MSEHRCPECGGPMIEIEVANGDAPLVMRSCSACDARQWSSAGQGIDLRAALRELSDTGGKQTRKG